MITTGVVQKQLLNKKARQIENSESMKKRGTNIKRKKQITESKK